MTKDNPPAEKVDEPPLLVTIASGMNSNLVVTAGAFPLTAGGPVVFDTRTPGELQPFAYWLLVRALEDHPVYQITSFASGQNLCLDSGAAALGHVLLAATAQPAQSQLWRLDPTTSGQQLISSVGVSKTVLGFAQDIPMKGMPLQLTTAPELTDTGDRFIIEPVVIPPTVGVA